MQEGYDKCSRSIGRGKTLNKNHIVLVACWVGRVNEGTMGVSSQEIIHKYIVYDNVVQLDCFKLIIKLQSNN